MLDFIYDMDWILLNCIVVKLKFILLMGA